MMTETTTPTAAPSTAPQPQKSRAWIVILAVLLIGVIAAYEWRYSDDMEQHIKAVNRDLVLPSAYGTGLLSSIQKLTNRANVSREIMETREHVHTAKDWVLAGTIKEAVEQSSTVAVAMGRTIAVWQESFPEDYQSSAATTSTNPPETPAASTAAADATTSPVPSENWHVDHDTTR